MVGVLAERLQCLYIEEVDHLVGVAVRVADIQKMAVFSWPILCRLILAFFWQRKIF